jgi:hypothetical protein
MLDDRAYASRPDTGLGEDTRDCAEISRSGCRTADPDPLHGSTYRIRCRSRGQNDYSGNQTAHYFHDFQPPVFLNCVKGEGEADIPLRATPNVIPICWNVPGERLLSFLHFVRQDIAPIHTLPIFGQLKRIHPAKKRGFLLSKSPSFHY